MKALYNIVTFAVSTVLVIYSLWNWKKRKSEYTNSEQKSLSSKWVTVCFWIILVAACLCRLYRFGEFPFLNQDSAMAAVDAKALWLYGTDRFGTKYPVHFEAWGYGQMSTLMSYMMVPLFALFGYSEITVRLPIFLASIAGIIAFYFLCRDLYGNFIGLVGMFIAAINPWHFTQSRWALDANLFPHFTIMALALLIHSVKSGKKGFLYLSMIFWGLTHYCYGISVYIIPVILLISCIYLCCKKFANTKDVILSVIIYLVIALPFFLCMIINTFDLPAINTPIYTIQNFHESRRSSDILFFAQDKGLQLWNNIKSIFQVIILQKRDSLWDGTLQFGHMGWCLTPFAISGIWVIISKLKSKDKCLFVLLIIYSIVALGSGLITANVNVNRINIFMYAFMFLIVSGVYQLLLVDKKSAIFVGFMGIGMFILFSHTYYTKYVEEFKKPEMFGYNLKCALDEINPDNYERIYLTPDSQAKGTRDVTEIEAIYVYDLDIPYIQGKTDINHGKKTVPYIDKYQYLRASQIPKINPDEKAAYIINVEDQDLFDNKKYTKKNYGAFMVVY